MLPTAVVVLLLVVIHVAPDILLRVGHQFAPDQLLLVVPPVVNQVPSLLVWFDHPHGGLLIGQLSGVRLLIIVPWLVPPEQDHLVHQASYNPSHLAYLNL